ncbi:hypothetical protein PM082_001603 [Marasmius tenuissimus]|nr:hypothetical protein PM082_001603 [Marasmius tenuissimus]
MLPPKLLILLSPAGGCAKGVEGDAELSSSLSVAKPEPPPKAEALNGLELDLDIDGVEEEEPKTLAVVMVMKDSKVWRCTRSGTNRGLPWSPLTTYSSPVEKQAQGVILKRRQTVPSSP